MTKNKLASGGARALLLGGVLALTGYQAQASSIVGGWGGYYPATPLLTATTFLPNGQYMHIEVGAPEHPGYDWPGIEVGTYSWNSATGAFSNTVTLDTNGDWGLSNAWNLGGGNSGPCTGNCRITVANGQATGEMMENGVATTTVHPSVQSWYLLNTPNAGDLIVFDLFSNGMYLLGIDPPMMGWFVAGMYDSATGHLTPAYTNLTASDPAMYRFTNASFNGGDVILTSETGQVALQSTVPEPKTLLLLGFGLAALAVRRRKLV